ncbi:histidine kinase [Chitinophaga barathri]|uniref:Histidine kinase n=1 Tax=Chitinophaga barathri TaxID=1647451 RepID=A0A3N4MEM0_9BACT|nr:histidine kinase [Chitinophaga barathri]RPD42432.1 histidine kinase [Chitinophaga barathri]
MNNIGKYRYFIHLVIWMALVGLYIFPLLRVNWNSPFGFRYMVVRYFVYGFINFNLFYLLVFYVLPLHGTKKYLRAAGVTLGVLVAFCGIKYGVASVWPDEVLQGTIAMIGFKKTYMSFWTYFRISLGTGIAVTFAAYAYYIFLLWRTGDKTSRRLELAAAAAHRQYTRMQFSSQLLLRKLKALEAVLADEYRRDGEGAEAVLQLSELLRYMLYDKAVRLDKAPLEKELHYFNIYLKLHNRLCPGQPVSLQMNGPASGRYVTPLQLQSAAEQLLAHQSSEAPVVLRLDIGTDTLALSSAPAVGWGHRLTAWLRRYQHMDHFKMPVYAAPA